MSSTGLIIIGAVAGGLTANPAVLESIYDAGLALKTFSETKDYKRKIEIIDLCPPFSIILQCIL